jgi:hypothetical protein
MAYTNSIEENDPREVERLIDRYLVCKQRKKDMNRINAYYRKHGTCHGCPGVSDDRASALDNVVGGKSSLRAPYSYGVRGTNESEMDYLLYRIYKALHTQEAGQ